jgi:hypothetical protein
MHQLPVEAQRVYMEQWLREVPYANVPKFNVEVPPSITPTLMNLITGYLILELQNKADKNVVRTMLHNLSVENNRDNPRFLGILLAAAEYTAATFNTNESPEDTIRNAVVITVAVAAAKLLHDFPILNTELSDSQQAEFRRYLEMGGEIQKEVKTHMYPYQQQPQYFLAADSVSQQPIGNAEGVHLYTDGQRLYHPAEIGMPVVYIQVMQPQFDNRPAGFGAPNNAPLLTNSQWNNNNNNNNFNQVDPNRPAINHGRFNNTAAPTTRQQMTTKPVVANHNRHVIADWTSDGGLPETRTSSINTTSQALRRPVVSSGTVPANRTAGGNVTEAVSEAVLAYTSKWAWMWTYNQPYPLAYDPRTSVLLHVKQTDDQGKSTVVHDIKPRTAEIEEVEYLEHELDPKLRAAFLRDREQAKKRAAKQPDPIIVLESQRGMLEVVESNSATIADLPPNETLTVAETIFVEDDDGVIVCSSLAEGVAKGEQKLRKQQISARTAFSFQAKVTQKLTISKADQDLIETLKLRESDFTAVAKTMADHQLLVDKPSRFWYILNDRLTKLVNDTIQYGMGIPVELTSFVEDGPAIMDHIETEFNAKIANILRDESDNIVFKALNTITVVEEDGVLFAFIADSVLTAVLPVTAMELNVNFDKQNYGLIIPSKLPILHRVLKQMVRGLEPLDAAAIVTSDNVVLHVHQGLIIPDSILLSV